jgi:type IV pilus modification protein PilV
VSHDRRPDTHSVRRTVVQPRAPRRARAAGFSMIELLVAVLVMGVGVLGIAALQMVSLQNNRAALVRAEAVSLAYDMMDRVRANPGDAPRGEAYDGLDLDEEPPAATNCFTGACTEAEMVAFDQALWKCQLGAYNGVAACVAWRAAGAIPAIADQPGLPNGDGAVDVLDTGAVQVRVEWSDAGGQTQAVVIESRV